MVNPWKEKRVLITRPQGSADEMAAAIRQRGAIPVFLPCIYRAPLRLAETLKIKWKVHFDFDWIFFTSAHAVRRFRETLSEAGITPPPDTRVAAIGQKTAGAAREAGFRVDFVLDSGDSVQLARAFLAQGLTVMRVLHPTGRQADGALERILQQAGISCLRVDLYENQPCLTLENLKEALDHQPDVLTFFSGSAVHAFFRCLEDTMSASIAGVPLVVLGKQTASVAQSYKHPAQPLIIAPETTLQGMLDALDRLFAELALNENEGV